MIFAMDRGRGTPRGRGNSLRRGNKESTPETPMPQQSPSPPARMALHARLQGVVFWLAVWTTLLSALFLGANRPVSWLALAAIALVLFTMQAGLDLFDRDAPGRWSRILPVAILYLGVICWAMIQAVPAPIAT